MTECATSACTHDRAEDSTYCVEHRDDPAAASAVGAERAIWFLAFVGLLLSVLGYVIAVHQHPRATALGLDAYGTAQVSGSAAGVYFALLVSGLGLMMLFVALVAIGTRLGRRADLPPR